MVGDFAVGKTSLTQQFVNHVFSEQYLTTIGVKIDTKTVDLSDGGQCKVIVWDVAGRDSMTPLQTSYLMGATSFMLVVDGTRRDSIDSVKFMVDSVRKKLPTAPFLVLINKSDLTDQLLFDEQDQLFFKSNGWSFVYTSAKTGSNVEKSFINLINLTMPSGVEVSE